MLAFNVHESHIIRPFTETKELSYIKLEKKKALLRYESMLRYLKAVGMLFVPSFPCSSTRLKGLALISDVGLSSDILAFDVLKDENDHTDAFESLLLYYI